MADYIPTTDADLSAWAANFYSQVDGALPGLGLVAADIATLATARTNFDASLAAANLAKSAQLQAVADKNTKRATLVAELRAIAKRVQAYPSLTDAQRASFGLTIPDTTPSAVPAPSSRPVVTVDILGGLKHNVKLTDEATPFSNAKPAGAIAAQIFVKYGSTAPVTVDDCVLLGQATKANYEVQHASDKAGQNAHYLARWITRQGLVGPTSQLTSATVAV